jgi:polyvinyl alcohol dehydrogenase (cytochrome)
VAKNRWLIASLLLAVTTAAVACSGSSSESRPPSSTAAAPAGSGECDWPMWGHNLSRTFAYPCATAISPETVGDLQQAWFFNTDDVVTATPAVADGVLYVGDWSGRFYALDAATGAQKWSFQAATEPNVYAGNIVSSAAVTDIDGTQTVVFASGRTLYALNTADGSERWHHEVGTADAQDFTEIESSPAIVDGKVIVGLDVHNRPGQPTGVIAVDLRTGAQAWRFDLEDGQPHGCGDVWSSPSVDTARNLAFVGSANCPSSPDGWGRYTEALIAIDVTTGQPRWAYQPHDPNNDDLDFAGAPNLFTTSEGQDLVGLGNKDGSYYAVDRDTGELVWKAKGTEAGIEEPGSNFSQGGFIGPTAYADGIIAAGTAVGPAPFVHAFAADDGDVLWQDSSVQAIYGAAAIANGVLFVGNNDFTYRAFDLHTGKELWQHEVAGVAAGGSAIVGDDVFTVAGIREPGLDKRSETSGVYRFTLPKPGETFAPSSSSSCSNPTRARASERRASCSGPTAPASA